MKKYLILIAAVILIFGCNTTKETVINPIDENAKKMIEEVELSLLNYKESGEKYDLQKANLLIKKLEELSKNNKAFEAKVIGLNARRDIVLNNFQKIESYISGIEKRNKNEESLFIVKALIEENIDRQIKILSEGIKKLEENNQLKILLADNYFHKGEFNKAVNLFDESLINLPEKYMEVYGFSRELSYKFAKNPPDNLESIDILTEKEITFKQLLEMIFVEADFLPVDIFKRKDSSTDAFTKVKLYGYIYSLIANDVEIDTKIKRKDLAFFLTYLTGKLENDPGLINKYRKSYSLAKDDLSPVRDVRPDDYYYSAVLVVVERELMDLPDGEMFFPEKFITGLELYEVIKKLNNMY